MSITNPDITARFPEAHPPLDRMAAVAEANRCLYCFDAPCMGACPTHIDVPRFIGKIATDNVRGSALAILEANVLGASCARVCPVEVLCEGACVLHRYNHKPIEIGRLQRHAMDHFYSHGARLPWSPPEDKPQRVACIGAGPASLACAIELRRRGYPVTIFDKLRLGGGLNTYGVAEYKLRAAESLREVELARSVGVRIETGVEIGHDLSIAHIERDFAAIFLGIGLGVANRLGIPGDDAPNVINALDFIADYKTAQTIRIGRRVAVVGGGNTAIDAAVAAERLGAREVHLIYRRGENDMSAFPFERDRARKHGVTIHFHSTPLRIHSIDGAVTAIDCARAGQEFRLPCDMVIPAVGQSHWLDLLRGCGVEVAAGRVVAAAETGQTTNPRYFAGGDCVNGGREVVDAAAAGKRAALGIINWLEANHG